MHLPWTLPSLFREVIRDWPEKCQSPFSDSFYSCQNGEKDFGKTPKGCYRISDHWNFMARGSLHCQTDIRVKRSNWALGHWDGERWHIIEWLPFRKLYEVPLEEQGDLSRAQLRHISNLKK